VTFWNTFWTSVSGKTSSQIFTEFHNTHLRVHAQLPFPALVFHKFCDRISHKSPSETISLCNTQQISPWVGGILAEDGLNKQHDGIGLEGTNNHLVQDEACLDQGFFLSITLVLLYYKPSCTSCPVTSGCGELLAIVCIYSFCKKH